MHLKIINTWILTKLNGQYLYANQIPYLIGLKGTIFSYKIQLFVHKEFNCSNWIVHTFSNQGLECLLEKKEKTINQLKKAQHIKPPGLYKHWRNSSIKTS